MAAGDYQVSLSNLSESEAAYVGILLQANDMSCCSSSGWIEPNSAQVGYVYFNLTQAATVDLSVLFGESYGNLGASKPILGLDYINAAGEIQAVQIEQDALNMIEGQNASYWANQATTQLEAGNYEQAIANYNKALEADPTLTGALYNKGLAEYYLEQYDSSMQSYAQALELNGNLDQAWNNLGQSLYALGCYQHAALSYEQASQINPNDSIYTNNHELATQQFAVQNTPQNITYPAVFEEITIETERLIFARLSNNGQYLLTNSGHYKDDKILQVWDTVTGKNLRKLTLPSTKNFIRAIFSPDGKYIIVYNGKNDSLLLWDISKNQTIKFDDTLYKENVFSFSHDNKQLAIKAVDNTIRFWDIEKAKEVKTLDLQQHVDSYSRIRLDPNEKYLATVSKARFIYIWDINTKQLVNYFKINSDLSLFQFSPDSEYMIATAQNQNKIYIWNILTGLEVAQLSVMGDAYGNDIDMLQFNKEETLLISKTSTAIQFWDIKTGGKEVARLENSGGSQAILTHDNTIAVVNERYYTKFWDLSVIPLQRECALKAPSILPALAIQPINNIVMPSEQIVQTQDGQFITLNTQEQQVQLRIQSDVFLQPHSIPEVFATHFTPIDIPTASEPIKIAQNIIQQADSIHTHLFSPDSRTLVTTHPNRKIKIWNIESGKQIAEIEGYISNMPISFSPDGTILAFGAYKNAIQLWDMTTGKASFYLTGHTAQVTHILFSPDGKTIASSAGEPAFYPRYGDTVVRLWDVTTGQQIAELKGHENGGKVLKFSFDGTKLATISGDDMIYIWDVATNQNILALNNNGREMRGLELSPDGKQVAVIPSFRQKNVQIWDIETAQNIAELHHEKKIGHILFISNTLLVFSDDYNNQEILNETIYIWDTSNYTKLVDLDASTLSDIQFLQFNANKQRLVFDDGRQVSIWDMKQRIKLLQFRCSYPNSYYYYSGSGCDTQLNQQGHILAGVNKNNDILLWDMSELDELKRMPKEQSLDAQDYTLSPDGNIIAAKLKDGTLRQWDITTGQEFSNIEVNDSFSSVIFQPNTGQLLGIKYDYKKAVIQIFDALTQTYTTQLEYQGYTGKNKLSFSPDGKRLAAYGYNNGGFNTLPSEIWVWDTATQQSMLKLKTHENWVNSVVFSPDSTRIVSASSDTTVRLWNAKTGETIAVFNEHPSWVNAATFSPDGKLIASASYDKAISIWDAETGQQRAVFTGHWDWVNTVAFSPDGKTLISGSNDQTIRLWDVETGQLKGLFATTDANLYTSTNFGGVNHIRFSPNAEKVIFVQNEKVYIWDYELMQQQLEPSVPETAPEPGYSMPSMTDYYRYLAELKAQEQAENNQ